MRDEISRGARGRVLRAAWYRRADGARSSVDVKCTDGVEELAFPTLFPNGVGGFRGVVGSREWKQYVERRIYFVNPLFRLNSFYLCFLFDIEQKTALQNLPHSYFFPDDVHDENGVA